QAQITVQFAGAAPVRAGVTVTNLTEEPPVDFAGQVVPVFTKLGCNAGGCHGKASGQNGFKLSLFGFEPAEDYGYLVRESRGRRVFLAAPDHSLFLLKPTGQLPHGGGKRLEKDSPFYNLLRRWVEQGARYDPPDAPVVQRIEVLPRERLLEPDSQQQLMVVAHQSDGSTVDVTRLAQFQVNEDEMAEVSATGLVTVKEVPGSVAVMARFQSHVAVFRALVPLGAPVTDLPPERNFIDELVFKQLRELGLPPSPLCDDATFVRRATIDIAGRLPTLEETKRFRADQDPGKYEKLIDRLLAGDDYADYFAGKWSAVLRNRRASDKDDPRPTFAFHAWIRDSLKRNRPYDQLVGEVLMAAGELGSTPPVVWYREVKDPTAQLEDTAQLFLGQRLQCARCHHHPLERWSQQDYYGLAAFFSRLEVMEAVPPRKGKKTKKGQEPDTPGQPFRVSFKPGPAQALNPRTGKPVGPMVLGGRELDLPASADPRQELVAWMTAKDNPYFARALVNRYWKHFLGRGLVEPEDDLRATNPASNPELLDALAQHFVDHHYDLKDLVRTICTSSVYRLSAVPNAANVGDRQNFSRFLPRRLNAEVLLDAIDTVSGSKTVFAGVPAETRAVQLPDNQFASYFLSVFGRPDAASACECERNSGSSLAQSLHLFNSEEVLEKISGRSTKPVETPKSKGGKEGKNKGSGGTPAVRTAGPSGGRLRELLADGHPHEARLRDLYLIALSREPSAEEMAVLMAHIRRKKDKVCEAYEDILWALLNTKEFLFNH
ncbi:MAG: DUF1553 domain-containing protein, partial [Planctomycetes bacterium]|nr:DUF1553 domain-containing protein [Planctomycetota bacterium]